jgi:methyltransferase (TIGR00027 family)
MPAHLTFVPIDFSADDLAVTLTQNGFSSKEQALFIWEGVTYYLAAEAVDKTFAALRKTATTGSEICFDYASLSREALHEQRTMKLREHMKADHADEPARFGIPEGKLSEFLFERGYQLVENLDGSEMEARYLSLRNGSTLGKVPALFALAVAHETKLTW